MAWLIVDSFDMKPLAIVPDEELAHRLMAAMGRDGTFLALGALHGEVIWRWPDDVKVNTGPFRGESRWPCP